MNQPSADNYSIPPFLSGKGSETDYAKKDEKCTKKDFSDDIASVDAEWKESYTKMRIPKTILKIPPNRMVQGTTL